jgi:hypothetical protein
MKRKLIASIIVLAVLFLILCGAAWLAHRIKAVLHASWHQSDLHLWSASDGPFVVTHLVCATEVDTGHGSPHVTACLPEPILITDSAGCYITNDEFQALSWIDYLGRPAEVPALGSKTQSVYYRPELSERTEPTSR